MSEQRWHAVVNPELMIALVDIAVNDERVAARFWAKVDKNTTDRDQCWIWTGALSSEGYGNFSVTIDGVDRTVRAHRMAWYLVHLEAIEGGLYLDHVAARCAGRYCVNPDHLEPVTKIENDARRTGSMAASKQRARRSEHLALR